MLTKRYSKDGKTCNVTFTLPVEVHARSAHIYGDFTDWEKAPLEMTPLAEGGFTVTITLATRKEYRFRYLLDGGHWENDWAADAYAPNPFGTQDSVLKL